MASSATSLKIDQKRKEKNKKQTVARKTFDFAALLFLPPRQQVDFIRRCVGEAPLLCQNSAAAAAAAAATSSLTELRMDALAANVSSFFTGASPHFIANQKEAANASQEHHTMTNDKIAVTRNLFVTNIANSAEIYV